MKYFSSFLILILIASVKNLFAQDTKTQNPFTHYISASTGITNAFGSEKNYPICGATFKGTYQLQFKTNIYSLSTSYTNVFEFELMDRTHPDNQLNNIELMYGKVLSKNRMSYNANVGFSINRFVTRGLYSHIDYQGSFSNGDYHGKDNWYQKNISYYMGIPLNFTVEYQLEKKKHIYGLIQPYTNINALETIVGINTGLKFKL